MVAAVVAAEEEERRVTSTAFAAFARMLNPGGSPEFILRCKGSEHGGRVVVVVLGEEREGEEEERFEASVIGRNKGGEIGGLL